MYSGINLHNIWRCIFHSTMATITRQVLHRLSLRRFHGCYINSNKNILRHEGKILYTDKNIRLLKFNRLHKNSEDNLNWNKNF